MTTLEKLAKGMFERYSERTTGHKAHWDYLSKPRKADWLREVMIMMEYLVGNLKDRLKAPPASKPNEAAYSVGYNQGKADERLEFMQFVEYLEKGLRDELEDYIHQSKKK